MAVYNFKKEAKVYIVKDGLRYLLDVYPDLGISQTFTESSIEVKTLHAQYDVFDKAIINTANPANFNVTIPVLAESDMSIVLNLLRDYNSGEANIASFDIYIENIGGEVYELKTAVIESGTIQIPRDGIITLSISGTASKLSRYTIALPGTLQSRTTRTHIIPSLFGIKIAGTELANVTGISIELKNTIKWLDNATIHKSMSVINHSNTIYPEKYILEARVLSGTIQQYTTNENNSTVNTWAVGSSILVRAGDSKTNWYIEVNIPSSVYTNRLELQDLYVQSFDFRMNSNPSDITQIIKTVTTASPLKNYANIWAT